MVVDGRGFFFPLESRCAPFSFLQGKALRIYFRPPSPRCGRTYGYLRPFFFLAFRGMKPLIPPLSPIARRFFFLPSTQWRPPLPEKVFSLSFPFPGDKAVRISFPPPLDSFFFFVFYSYGPFFFLRHGGRSLGRFVFAFRMANSRLSVFFSVYTREFVALFFRVCASHMRLCPPSWAVEVA